MTLGVAQSGALVIAGPSSRRLSWRLPALSLLVLIIVFGPTLTSAVSAQPLCQPRPPVRISSTSIGPGRLQVMVTAGQGVLQTLAFAGGGNALVEIDGQTRRPPFTYPVAGGSTQKAFSVVRDGNVGTPTTLSFTVTDGCGPWQTFVGGGTTAWEAPFAGQILNAADGLPLAGASVSVQGTGLNAITGQDGRFAFALVPKGTQTLTVTGVGFVADTRPVVISSTQQSSIVVGLHRDAAASLTTVAGTSVVVAPGDTDPSGVQRAAVTFQAVSAPGVTSLRRVGGISGATPPSLPVAGGAYFEVATTATVSGSIDVELPFDPSTLAGSDPSQLRLLRFQDGSWIDQTLNVNRERHTISGQMPSINAASASSGARAASASASLGLAIVIDILHQVTRPDGPLQAAPAPPPRQIVLFVRGIKFACPLGYVGVPLAITGWCDIPGDAPESVVRTGQDTFREIRSRLLTSPALGFSEANSTVDSGTSFRYFSYSPSFRTNGFYPGSDTRLRLDVSAERLREQIDYWGTDGITYDIVTHSLGGAVVMTWLSQELVAADAADSRAVARLRAIRSVVTLDGPVGGMQGVLGTAGHLIGASGAAGQDLLLDTTVARMRGAILDPQGRTRVVTLANSLDNVVPSSKASFPNTCPPLVDTPIPNCVFQLGTWIPSDEHGEILKNTVPLQIVEWLLRGLTVRGRIINIATGQGIGAATVSLENSSLSTTTRPDGTYELLRVPLAPKGADATSLFGSRRLNVSASGYDPATVAVVQPAPTATAVDQPTISLAASSGKVVGSVTDADGLPINGATIQVQGTSLSSTQILGQYAIFQVPPGIQSLVFSAPGFVSLTRTVPVTANATIRVDVVLQSSPGTSSWSQLTPVGPSPSGRVAHTAIWDPVNGQMLIFGGQGFVGASFDFLNQLWSYRPSTNQWSSVMSGGVQPPVRRDHVAAWDSANGQMLVFGGYDNSAHLDDLWSYSPTSNDWSQLSPASPRPLPRAAHSAVWDPIGRQFLVYGGHNGQFLSDLWAYRPATNSWTQLGLSGPTPGPRAFQSTVWDPVNNRMLLFAGQDNSGFHTDLWAYQPQTDSWTLISPANATPPIDGRGGHTAVWDAQNNQMVVFAGNTSIGYVNTVLVYQLAANTWFRPMINGSTPDPRDNHAAIWDPINQRTLIFSGYTGGAPADLWTFVP